MIYLTITRKLFKVGLKIYSSHGYLRSGYLLNLEMFRKRKLRKFSLND